ncbi:MAG TPA: ADOP family duplicated permease, partial [Longimicrobiales bacterium]|nr:ADOP family duplicated permease [Longimicrobiales bacterium]
GVAPALGRDFTESDDVGSAPSVVILSHALWQSRFAADPAILGRHIHLDDRDHTVVGVMPAGFDNVLRPGAGLWAPLQYNIDDGRAWGHHLRMVGRLRAGTTPDDGVRELNTLGSSIIAAERPPTYGDDVRWIAPALQHDLVRGVRPALLAMLGAVTLLLVMACVSVANLILVRSVQRRDEFALRMSLGAGRGRMVRQLVTESLVLAAAGAALGMAVAQVGIRALVARAPGGLPRVDAIGLDISTLLLAGAVTTLVGIVFGVTPSLIGNVAGKDAANRPATRHTAGRRQHRIRSGLVIAQVALALMLLTGSGLLLRSLQQLLSVPSGFDAESTLSLQIQVTGGRAADDDAVRQYFTQLLEEATRVPGVAAAGLTNQLPLSGDHDTWGVHFETGDTRRAGEPATFRYAVTPGYFQATGVPLRSGRLLGESDRAGTPLAAVINESLARRRFPDRDPLGQQLRIGPTDSAPYTVVGVVGDVTHESLALGATDAVYITTDQWRFGDRVMTLVVRAHGDVSMLAAPLRDAIWSVDSDQPITRVARLDDLVAASAAERRFALMVFQAFALAALLLAATGLYGVVAGSVAERTRELGIRSALGAARPALVSLVLAQGLRLAGLGIAAGLGGAVIASRAIDALLFGVSRLDP